MMCTSVSSATDVAQTYATSLPNPAQQYLDLLEGKLSDFQYFAGGERSQWLIDVAHGFLVNPNDPLRAWIYEYRVAAPIRLTKISDRQDKSATSRSNAPQTMRTRVLGRDGLCWISRETGPRTIKSSHICPKRMGDEQGRFLYEEFTNMPSPAGLSIFHPIFGVTLFTALDAYFDFYEVALKPTNGDYVVHDFSGKNLNIYGVNTVPTPVLHGHQVSPPNPASDINPPAGLFWWHYLQCVIVKFGCLGYRDAQNIFHYEKPMRMEDDLDDDNDNDDDGFLWPTAQL
ncbi:hypothetical protein BT96DRAFT_1022433 [Gymnopus androsaceus JB14]|uniref:Uncharacterized protein n=1 Tax=Gymnopus androsaceus JB14 TaxID=1447944 RepID=A0A6A4HBI3_9AGAR|nr:hypothetical protein BT96DRAFT_1022433 [Gymnopus androsaceus JB14]